MSMVVHMKFGKFNSNTLSTMICKLNPSSIFKITQEEKKKCKQIPGKENRSKQENERSELLCANTLEA